MRIPMGLAIAVSAVLCAACSDSGTSSRAVGPSPIPSAAPPPANRLPVTIVSGADLSPVAGARVLINNIEFHTGPSGQVEFDQSSGANDGDKVDVDAPGFLTRRTRLTTTRLVTLWPVASDEEAEAVRQMVYRRGGTVDKPLTPLYPSEPFYVALLSDVTPQLLAVWAAAVQDFGNPFGVPYEVTTWFQYEANEMSVYVGGAQQCVPITGWGFCGVSSASPYMRYHVEADQAADPVTIRRLLAYRFLGPNPLPGLMNLAAPADQLSELEARTIRMILLRPLPNRWPDSDR